MGSAARPVVHHRCLSFEPQQRGGVRSGGSEPLGAGGWSIQQGRRVGPQWPVDRGLERDGRLRLPGGGTDRDAILDRTQRRHAGATAAAQRSEEHTSELPSLMRISYAVFCLKKKRL